MMVGLQVGSFISVENTRFAIRQVTVDKVFWVSLFHWPKTNLADVL